MTGESRRQFLERMGRVAAAAMVGRALTGDRSASAQSQEVWIPKPTERATTAGIDPARKSVVASLVCDRLIPSTQVNEGLLREVIEEGVRLATSAKRDGNPWNKIIETGGVVGLKFDPVSPVPFETTLPMARQIVHSLMTKAKVPAENIMIIDVQTNVRRAVEDSLSETLGAAVRTRPQMFTFGAVKARIGHREEKLADWLSEVSVIVNVPLLRTHNISGIAGSLTNLAYSLIRRPGRYYDNGCTPFVGDVLSLPQVKAKMGLHVVNSLRAVFDGGPDACPETLWDHRGIILSTDPVAADTAALDVINQRREEAKLPPIGDSRGHLPHIHDAASRGLGTDDQDYLTIRTA
jgi:hypothetical protein